MATITVKTKPTRRSAVFQPLLKLKGLINLTLRRQQYHLGLALLALIGIVLAVGLVTDASFFSEAVDRVILTQELHDFSLETGRPPFSTNVYVFPSSRKPLTLEDAENLSRHIAETLSSEVGLPVRHAGMQVSSGSMMLQPSSDSGLYGQDFLGSIEIDYISGVNDQMAIDAGVPLDEDGASHGAMDVWMHQDLAQEMGANLGEILNLRLTVLDNPIPVRLAGFWHAKDPQSDFWFTNPDSQLKKALLVRRQDYIQYIQPVIPARTREASWYLVLDEQKIIPRDGAIYLAGFQKAKVVINKYLPDVQLNTPPLDPLKSFVQRSQALTILLLSYNLPAFGILLYFLGLASAIIAQWQRKETATFVSRGMSLSGVLNLVMLEELILFIIGYPLGIALGMLIARVMGYTASFLSFTSRPPLPVSLLGLSLPLTFLALSVALLSRLIPAAQGFHQSVVTEEREWVRPVQGPFWYRYYLDLVLILPTYYAYDQMVKHGSLANLIITRPEDLYRDPLLILVPALFVVTASLVTMRLFAWVMRAIDLLAGLTPWLTLHLALRQLGRQSQDYIRPLLLVLISLAMGVYTLSMAASLDHWLVDRVYYQYGADFTLNPQPLVPGTEGTDGSWIPVPEEFDKIAGVVATTRVGIYPSRVQSEVSGEIRARFLAIDRLDFPSVAWFRADLADESLGGLMNRLAIAPEGVLVSQRFLSENGYQIGDPITIQINLDFTTRTTANFTIAGDYTYFPTTYEDTDGFTIIGNLDYLTTLFGFTPSHDIWLKLDQKTSGTTVMQAIPGSVGVATYTESVNDTRAILAEAQAQMERVGIFGTLSIGFLATAAMAILGLLIFSYASLRERVYRFAVLHSIGLLNRQIVTQVVMEYTFLALFGALAGTFIGVMASRAFIPFFRYTGARGIPLPPLVPILAMPQVRILALIFTVIIVLAEVVTITLALRKRLVRVK